MKEHILFTLIFLIVAFDYSASAQLKDSLFIEFTGSSKNNPLRNTKITYWVIDDDSDGKCDIYSFYYHKGFFGKLSFYFSHQDSSLIRQVSVEKLTPHKVKNQKQLGAFLEKIFKNESAVFQKKVDERYKHLDKFKKQLYIDSWEYADTPSYKTLNYLRNKSLYLVVRAANSPFATVIPVKLLPEIIK